MECPDGCPKQVYDVMRDCWDIDPKQRPTFKKIYRKLDEVYRSFVPVGNWFKQHVIYLCTHFTIPLWNWYALNADDSQKNIIMWNCPFWPAVLFLSLPVGRPKPCHSKSYWLILGLFGMFNKISSF